MKAIPASGWLELLEDRGWHHLATLTCSREMSGERLARSFEHGYVRALSRIAQNRIRWFYSVEGGSEILGRTHLHCLLEGTERLRVAKLQKVWSGGHSRVVVFDPSRRGIQYVTKHIDPDSELWGLSLPPKRLR